MANTITIEGITYPLDDIGRLSMRDLLLLENQSEEATGRRVTMNEIKQAQEEIAALKTREAKENHPMAPTLFAVAVWVARRRAGETCTLSQALEFDPDTMIVHVDEPPPDPTKARSRKGSGAGANRAGVPSDRKRKTAASRPKSSAT